MTTAPTVAALVVSYNTSDDLVRCVASLNQSGASSIHVLDNGSTDPTAVDTLRTLAARAREGLPSLTARFSQANLGFAAGINSLARQADGFDYLWFVNPDAVVEAGSATALAVRMRDMDIAIASPLIRTGEDGDQVWFAGGVLHLERGMTEHLLDIDPSPVVVDSEDFITGAAMMVSTAAWADLGGFDESLFLYWEDAELTRRARALGWSVGTVTDITVWHREGGSGDRSGFSEVFYYYMNRNRLLVCRDSPTGRLSLVAGRGLRYTIRLWAGALRERRGRWRKLYACALGVRDGIAGTTGRNDRW